MKRVLVGLLAISFAAVGCGTPRRSGPPAPEMDPVVERHLESGGRAHARADYRAAEKSFRAALRRAELSDQPEVRSLALYNLAVVDLDRGEVARAKEWLEQVEPGAPSELLLSRVELEMGDAAGAAARLDRLLSDAGPLSKPELAQAFLLQAELAVAAEDLGGALGAIERGEASELGSAMGMARWQTVLGWVAGQEGRLEDRARALDAAAEGYRQGKAWGDMARALAAAGEAWLAAGESAEAADRYLRAVRSLEAQGLREEAAVCAEACLALPDLGERTRLELERIMRATP